MTCRAETLVRAAPEAPGGERHGAAASSMGGPFPASDPDVREPEVRRRLSTLESDLATALTGGGKGREEVEDDPASRNDRVIAACYETLARDVRNPAVLTELGDALRRRGKLPVAIMRYQMAVAVDPTYGPAQRALGDAYLAQGKPKPAIACYDKALRSAPDDPALHERRARALLANGSYATGWDEYVWHLRTGAGSAGGPYWEGPPEAGQSITVVADQDLLRQIVFAHCLGDLIDAGARVTLHCDPRLVDLFIRSFKDIWVHPLRPEEQIEPTFCDAVTGLACLPRILRRSRSAFRRPPGYLGADPRLVDQWRSRYATFGEGPTVAVSFRPEDGVEETMPALSDWLPLLRAPGVRFVCLDPDAAEDVRLLQRDHGLPVGHWPGEPDTASHMDDLAARIAAADVVIAPAGTTAALAGALGTRVWTLAPVAGDCIWPVRGRKSPWFPTMSLFRRRPGQPWSKVMARVTDELAALAGTGVDGPSAPALTQN